MTVQDGYHNMIKAFETLCKNNGSKVVLNQQVMAIEYIQNTASVKVTTSTGEQFSAPTCICTLPLGVLQKNPPTFSPPLPQRRLKSIRKLGFGVLNKIVLTYPNVWWTLASNSFAVVIPEDHDTEEVPIVKKRCVMIHSYEKITDGRPTLVVYLGVRNPYDLSQAELRTHSQYRAQRVSKWSSFQKPREQRGSTES